MTMHAKTESEAIIVTETVPVYSPLIMIRKQFNLYVHVHTYIHPYMHTYMHFSYYDAYNTIGAYVYVCVWLYCIDQVSISKREMSKRKLL